MPRRRQSRSRSAHDSVDSRSPSASDEFLAAVGAYTHEDQDAGVGLAEASITWEGTPSAFREAALPRLIHRS